MPTNPYEPPKGQEEPSGWNASDYVALVMIPAMIALALAALLLPGIT